MLLWNLPGWTLNYDVWAYRWIPAAVRWSADSTVVPILLTMLGTALLTVHLTLTAVRGGEPYRSILKSLATRYRSWQRRTTKLGHERHGLPVKCEVIRSDGSLLQQHSPTVKLNESHYFQIPHAPSRNGQTVR